MLKESADEEWASLLIHFGDVFLLPDGTTMVKTKPGKSGNHPWVVVEDYKPPHQLVRSALRSTRGGGRWDLFTRADGVAGLTQDGWISLRMIRRLQVGTLREHENRGRLSKEVRQQLRELMKAWEEGAE